MNYVPWSRKTPGGVTATRHSLSQEKWFQEDPATMRGVTSPTVTHYPTKPYSYLDTTLQTFPVQQLPKERRLQDCGAGKCHMLIMASPLHTRKAFAFVQS